MPEVKDVTILSALMSTIWTINEFETVWLLTGGGPNGTTEVMNVYSYKTAMRSMMLGRGIAVAVLAMPVLMILLVSLHVVCFRKVNDQAAECVQENERRII